MKRRYQKPQIERVKLVPKEAVLDPCKTWATQNPAASCKCGGVGANNADGS